MAGRKKSPAAVAEAAAKSAAAAQSAAEPAASSTRALLFSVFAICSLHAFACMWVRNLGFDHISDDDFSRVTIAQGFAHHAHLDPSGTSWLPFPFWIMGFGMKLLGRDLATARGLAIFFASLAAPLPWLALRLTKVPGWRAFGAIVFAFGTPWAIWTGAATVPESFTASLTAAGVIALASASTLSRRALIGFAGALFAACLSRYEAWPAAAVAAIALGLQFRDTRRKELLGAIALCVAAPLLWMAWNAHAHDGPLHFFRRVSTFKRAIGDGSTSLFDSLVFYPKLLFAVRPEVTLPALVLTPLAIADKAVRKQWGLPLAAVLAEVVFLAIGNARDGAPAHHSERALLACFVILALYVGFVLLTPWVRVLKDEEAAKTQSTPKAQRAFMGFVIVAWLVTLLRADGMTPGTQPSELRDEQMQRGDKLRRDGAKKLEVTPCGYEHFALVAAFGEPENVTVNQSHFGGECPKVEVKD